MWKNCENKVVQRKSNNIFALNGSPRIKRGSRNSSLNFYCDDYTSFVHYVSLAANNTLMIFLNLHNRSLAAYIKLTIWIL